MKIQLNKSDSFKNRHIGPSHLQVEEMLKIIGSNSIDSLIDETIPSSIRVIEPMNLPNPMGENEFIEIFK